MPIRYLRVSFMEIKIDSTMFVIVSRSKTNSYGLFVLRRLAVRRYLFSSWLRSMGSFCAVLREGKVKKTFRLGNYKRQKFIETVFIPCMLLSIYNKPSIVLSIFMLCICLAKVQPSVTNNTTNTKVGRRELPIKSQSLVPPIASIRSLCSLLSPPITALSNGVTCVAKQTFVDASLSFMSECCT